MPKKVKSLLKREPQPHFIRKWRNAAHLSQDALVERVREDLEGFSKSTLSRIENNKQFYTQPILEALAKALGCSPADLIMRDPDSPTWSLFDVISKLPEAQRTTVVQMIDGLRKAS